MTRRSRPNRIRDNDCFGLLPGAFKIHRIGLMCKRIAARPHNQPHFRIGHLRSIKVNDLARVDKAVRKSRHRNDLAALPGQRRRLHGLHRA